MYTVGTIPIPPLQKSKLSVVEIAQRLANDQAYKLGEAEALAFVANAILNDGLSAIYAHEIITSTVRFRTMGYMVDIPVHQSVESPATENSKSRQAIEAAINREPHVTGLLEQVLVDREDFRSHFESNGWTLPQFWFASSHGKQPKPVQRSAAQDDTILATLKELGYDPLALPQATRSGGAKAQVKRLLVRKNDLFQSEYVFKKAWERLHPEYIKYK